ncbi:hypothetical protein NESM_000341900 [Novymonas esmeraldas]|uniref:Uncharacterized protein n=1 Tax=Novymonas esmeraldas TaxID=1808958 RepID=A0AAW0ELJ6_9TRYP
MADAPPALVVYAGQVATYVCDAGDVQPTYPTLPPITEELLRLVRQRLHISAAAHVSGPSPSTASAAAAPGSTPVDGVRRQMQQRADNLCQRVLPLMAGRQVVLVVPLCHAASYREEWVRLCFDAHVRTRRLVLMSDTVASAFACGVDSGVVLHASLFAVSVCRVEAGSSTRYGHSSAGGVQALCGARCSSQLMAEWPELAAVLAAAAPPRDAAAATEAATSTEDATRLSSVDWAAAAVVSPACRDALIRAFGFKAYTAVVVRALAESSQQQQRPPSTSSSSKGKGKGGGGGRHTASLLLAELRRVYPRAARRAPGQLEKLLARVVQGGSPAQVAGDTEPCVLAGEALAVPHLRDLFHQLVTHCGDDLWAVVERERRLRKRCPPAAVVADGISAPVNSGAAAPASASQDSAGSSSDSGDDSDTEETTPDRPASDSASSSPASTSSSVSDASEDASWLHPQPTPLPTAPWWLPLLGGSIVGRLTDHDLQRALITEEEARESNGAVVHDRILL